MAASAAVVVMVMAADSAQEGIVKERIYLRPLLVVGQGQTARKVSQHPQGTRGRGLGCLGVLKMSQSGVASILAELKA